MYIVQPQPPKISEVELKLLRKKVMSIFGFAISFFVNIVFIFFVGLSPWSLVIIIASFVSIIFFGFTIQNTAMKKKSPSSSDKSSDGGGPLIH